jgi:hypothetical protein
LSTVINPNYHEFAEMMCPTFGVASNMVSNAICEAQAIVEHATEADGAWAHFNPWNTCEDVSPCSDFNSIGVKVYWSKQQAVYANVKTARDIMPTVVKAIQDADASLAFSSEGLVEYDKWGGRSGYGLEVQQIFNEIMNGQLI